MSSPADPTLVDAAGADGTPVTERSAALKVALLQAVLLATWTLYALFLPRMAERAGFGREWIAWILLADQLLFVATDWMAGVMADRLVAALARVGRWLVAASLASAAGLALMSPAARLGSTLPWIVCLVLWAASSSFLRAPAFSLLSRVGGVSRKSGIVNWALIGVALAGATGPLLTSAAARVDPELPLAMAALALAVSAWIVSGLDAASRAGAAPSEAPRLRPEALHVALGMLACAFAVQVHTTLVPQAAGAPGRGMAWAVVFWGGFALGLPLASWARARGAERGLRWSALGLGGLAMPAAALGGTPVFVVAQGIAGAAWAAMFSLALGWALARGKHGVGSAAGLLFSAIAAAAVLRLAATGLGLVSIALPVAAAAWWLGATVLTFRVADAAAGGEPAR